MTKKENIRNTTAAGLRYERKFVVEYSSVHDLVAFIKHHPAFFREVYAQRQVNNIYFDTREYQFYYENVAGISKRIKYRIRWYGDFFGKVERPVLEIKTKESLVGDKFLYPLQSFEMGLQGASGLIKVIQEEGASDLKPNLLSFQSKPNTSASSLIPSLYNQYQRRYFVSADGNFRITIDWDQKFATTSRSPSRIHFRELRPHLILELKYGIEHDKEAQAISQRFPFRLSRNSKYVEGMELTH